MRSSWSNKSRRTNVLHLLRAIRLGPTIPAVPPSQPASAADLKLQQPRDLLGWFWCKACGHAIAPIFSDADGRTYLLQGFKVYNGAPRCAECGHERTFQSMRAAPLPAGAATRPA